MNRLTQWLADAGLGESWVALIAGGIKVLLLLVISALIYWLPQRILLAALTRVIRRTKTQWDDAFLDRKVLHRIAHLAPALVIAVLGPMLFAGSSGALFIIGKIVGIYVALVILAIFMGFLDALVDIYRGYEISRHRPIKGYLQVVKIILAVAVVIYIISSLMNRSPVVLLSGLGAMTAILLLIFKDTILGFVASIQLVGNDMVRIGDWIAMPQYGADGDVIDMNLTTVKVQNWDKTITTVPTYSLVSQSFKNWRGMDESGGRRIKRDVHIDVTSIRFLSPEDVERYRKIQHLTEYMDGKVEALKAWNAEHGVVDGDYVNGRRMTNVGTFRAYLTEYLRKHPMIKQDMTCMVRQLPPGEHGLPIQIYAFSKDQRWVFYEGIQADIFDHILAVLPEFGLRVFQDPTGADFKRVVGS